MSNIIALKTEIEDENTGAIANYHVIEYYSVDLRNRIFTAVVNGYVSAKAFKMGRNHLTFHSASFTLPDGNIGDALQWAYEQLMAQEGGAYHEAQSVLAS